MSFLMKYSNQKYKTVKSKWPLGFEERIFFIFVQNFPCQAWKCFILSLNLAHQRLKHYVWLTINLKSSWSLSCSLMPLGWERNVRFLDLISLRFAFWLHLDFTNFHSSYRYQIPSWYSWALRMCYYKIRKSPFCIFSCVKMEKKVALLAVNIEREMLVLFAGSHACEAFLAVSLCKHRDNLSHQVDNRSKIN